MADLTITAGIGYYLGDDPGGISPIADVTSGDYVVQLGLSTSTTVLALRPEYTGVAT